MKTETLYLTREEAARIIKRAPYKSSKFCVSIRLDGNTADGKRYVPDALASYARLSRTEALRLCADLLDVHGETRGLRITLHINHYPEYSTYWITQ